MTAPLNLPTPAGMTKILIVGGSYAGLSAIVNLLDLGNGLAPRMVYPSYKPTPDAPRTPVEITLVDERDGFFHLIGTPLAFASNNYARQSWIRYADIPALQVPNVRFVQGSVTSLDCAAKKASILNQTTKETSLEDYDFLIAASGLRRPYPVVPQSLNRKQFLIEAEEHIHDVTNAPQGVVVVGGGAVGIEMAAELKLVQPDIKVTLIHSRDQLLSSEALSDECKEKALELLKEANVEVILGKRVKDTKTETKDGVKKIEVELSDGSTLIANEIMWAISNPVPSSQYFPAAALDEEGYVHITPSLHLTEETGIPNYKSHWIVGDVCRWSGMKRAGRAMHMGYYAAVNIHQTMLSRIIPGHEPFQHELEPIPAMIGLAVGKKAVASGPEGTTSGEDVMQAYFRDDLGLAICWEYMRLSDDKWKDRLAAGL
ncbi:hypothetical protein jhhlp_001567 [Lomentospora prolificans]|uniref:FAD/NAD(P)-binding domain-containing protein n=1 Tax=Lomentospora prolificans TaxID=41688 RepID=A0A2N3NIJ8_9PEZI|nr:hypothetical protein jhhlp_001567 [Lomentospora prolificans]